MRGLISGLTSPHPLAASLPAPYQEDEFTQRFAAAFDEALAPIFSTLDGLGAHLDADLTPEDFLDWLGSWLGLVLDETWPLERRRVLVSRAAELYRRRGTVGGLADEIEIFTGVQPEIVESGGTASSSTPGTAWPGEPEPGLTVRLRVANPKTIDTARLQRLVDAARPAHIAAEVEVLPP